MTKMKTIMWFGFVLGALSAAGKVIFTKPGQKAKIECNVNAFSNLHWLHGNEMVIKIIMKTGFKSRGTSGGVAARSELRQDKNLEILEVKEEDAGKFTCVTDGNSQEHTLIVVSVSTSPSGDLQLGSEATLQCKVKGSDPGYTVRWTRPDGKHFTSQTVQLKPVAHSDAGSWSCTIASGELTHIERLHIKVYEPTYKTSAPVTLQGSMGSKPAFPNCVTSPPSTITMLLDLSWWVWVAGGVGCLVVVLLIVAVIFMCKRIKRRKRKLLKMKYDHQRLKSKPYCQCKCPAAAAKPQQGCRREKPSALPLQPLLME